MNFCNQYRYSCRFSLFFNFYPCSISQGNENFNVGSNHTKSQPWVSQPRTQHGLQHFCSLSILNGLDFRRTDNWLETDTSKKSTESFAHVGPAWIIWTPSKYCQKKTSLQYKICIANHYVILHEKLFKFLKDVKAKWFYFQSRRGINWALRNFWTNISHRPILGETTEEKQKILTENHWSWRQENGKSGTTQPEGVEWGRKRSRRSKHCSDQRDSIECVFDCVLHLQKHRVPPNNFLQTWQRPTAVGCPRFSLLSERPSPPWHGQAVTMAEGIAPRLFIL